MPDLWIALVIMLVVGAIGAAAGALAYKRLMAALAAVSRQADKASQRRTEGEQAAIARLDALEKRQSKAERANAAALAGLEGRMLSSLKTGIDAGHKAREKALVKTMQRFDLLKGELKAEMKAHIREDVLKLRKRDEENRREIAALRAHIRAADARTEMLRTQVKSARDGRVGAEASLADYKSRARDLEEEAFADGPDSRPRS